MADSHDTAASMSAHAKEKNRAGPPPKDVVIIEDGDVLLICDGSGEFGRLLVSSIVLKHTSPVFKAMLGPHYAEGQVPRSALHPQEIHCPEDDWHPMECLVQLLHHCESWLEEDLRKPDTLSNLISLGELADKYGCTGPISLQIEIIFAQYRGSHITVRPKQDKSEDEAGLRDCHNLAVAAFLFGKDAYFQLFTKRIVMDFVGSYSTLLDAGETVLGFKFLVKLDEQRNAARLKISEGVPNMAVAAKCNRCGATHSTTFMTNVHRAMNLEASWPPPFSLLSLRLVLAKLRSVAPLTYYFPLCDHKNIPPQHPDTFQNFADEVYEDMAGMCLPCAKAGSFTTGPCRIEGHWKPAQLNDKI